MAFSHGAKTRVYWNGFDLTRYSRDVTTEPVVDTVDTSTFGTDSKTHLAGMIGTKVTLAGLMDGAATGNEPRLFADLQANTTSLQSLIGIHLPQGDTVGASGYGFQAFETTMKVNSPIKDVVMLDASFDITGKLDRIQSYHPLGAEASAFTGTDRDNGATSANGAVGFIQCDGSGSAGASTWLIEGSPDGATWTTFMTFAALAHNVRSAQKVEAVGTVPRHTRVTSSAGTNAANVFVGFGRR